MTYLNPEVERIDCNITIQSDRKKRELTDLKQILRSTWKARMRTKVESLSFSEKHIGEVYEIRMKNGECPPVLGGYTDSLLWFNWGCLDYSEESMYVSQLIKSGEGRFQFEGRENCNYNISSIRKVPDIPVEEEVRQSSKRGLDSLKKTLVKVWPVGLLNEISSIKLGISSGKSYRIMFNDGFPKNEFPISETIDSLVTNGWGLRAAGDKFFSISKIKYSNSRVIPGGLAFDGINSSLHIPKACERCEEREVLEIRGINSNQNISLCDYCLDVVGEKTKSFDDIYITPD